MSGLYDYRWQKASKAFLALHPLCKCFECMRLKRMRAATVVDHDPPHRGDSESFWNQDTWRSMSKQCHDSFKQRQEKSGTILGADVDGVPVDPRHHWNK